MSSPKRALITGVTGQDGSYLADFLLDQGFNYQAVGGMIRRRAVRHLTNIPQRVLDSDRFELIEGDMLDPISIRNVIWNFQPTEIYNLAAQTFVGLSWAEPVLTNNVNYIGFLHLLEACRVWVSNEGPLAVYQASSSEMYGNEPGPQNELTRMIPRSPYGVSKLAAHRMANVYRESFDMYISCGICFNHESPRRGEEFVTRKIAKAAAEFARGRTEPLRLGNIDAKRDWGFAGDYVVAMWDMLQQDEPSDYVIATGETYSVRNFLERAFAVAKVSPTPERVQLNVPEYTRPAEVNLLLGDATKARNFLGWQPSTDFNQLVELMVTAELDKPQ